MPTLAACGNIFSLAFGVNAIIPIALSDLQRAKENVSNSKLRSIQEAVTDFKVTEKDRSHFIEFTFKSSGGLRIAEFLTYFTLAWAMALSAISLWELYQSAENPNRIISSEWLAAYITVALVIAPTLYFVRERAIKWIHLTIVTRSNSDEQASRAYADLFKLYLEQRKVLNQTEKELTDVKIQMYKADAKLRRVARQQRIKNLIWTVRSVRTRLRSHLTFKRTDRQE